MKKKRRTNELLEKVVIFLSSWFASGIVFYAYQIDDMNLWVPAFALILLAIRQF